MPIQSAVHSVTARLSDREVIIPYWSLTAGQPGPTLLVTAALHGNEVQGGEVIRRLREAALGQMTRGRMLLAPFVNLPAVQNRRPHITSGPETPYGVPLGYNINGVWPGDPAGTDSARVAHALFPVLAEPADFALDFHCWPGMRGTTALYRKGHPGTADWARLACVRFAQGREKPAPTQEKPVIGQTLTGWMLDHGRQSLCIEISGQYTMVEREIMRALRAALNIVKKLELIPGTPEGLDEEMAWLPEARVETIKAPYPGLFAGVGLAPSDRVEAGQLLGRILGDRDLQVTELRAPIGGYLWTYGRFNPRVDVSLAAMHPFVDAGEVVAEIAAPNDQPGG